MTIMEDRSRTIKSKRRRFQRRRNIGGGVGVNIDLAVGQTSPVNTSPVNFTVRFSLPVTGFTSADVSTAGSTVSGTLIAVVTGTGPYNIAVTGMTGFGMIRVSIPAGVATDSFGRATPASNVSSVQFMSDVTPPSVPTGLIATPTG